MQMTALRQLKAQLFSAIQADTCTFICCTAADQLLALMHCEDTLSISKVGFYKD